MSGKRYPFPAPVLASRVLRARLLIEASGKRFVWDEGKGKHVLTEMNERTVKQKWERS
jgi:hypothetical protein